jgi:uncharacterized protein (TIGR03792 family)
MLVWLRNSLAVPLLLQVQSMDFWCKRSCFTWIIGIILALLLVGLPTSFAMTTPAIESLTFQVPPERQAEFIQRDTEIWTSFLADQPGFISKEIWINPSHPDEVVLIVHWASREQWHAIPQSALKQTTERFNKAVGADYPLVASQEYQLKFHTVGASTQPNCRAESGHPVDP